MSNNSSKQEQNEHPQHAHGKEAHDHPHDPAHGEDHPHPHPHEHDHDHDHDRDHHHGSGVWGWISTIFHLHGHGDQHQALATDSAFMDTNEGIRTVWLALAALTITALLQVVIVWISGSVALLADTVHNIVDGLNSVPLLIAFYLARRMATRRYTYGFARAEDVAGVFIVLSIAVSAGIIFWESFQKLFDPQPLTNLGWVAVAAIVGFLGNEAVAWLQIRKGREIGSAALVADGLHARTDGLTSLAVLVAVGGVWLGFPIVDPIVGFLIGIAILFITRDATISMWYRLMDAIEPELMDQAEAVVESQTEVKSLRRLRMRWMGHRLHAEIFITVDPELTLAESHHIVEHVRHALFHGIRRLSEVVVHVDPHSDVANAFHEETDHHERAPQPIRG
jgi:cation diffusion facilitator family transporter